MEPGGSAELLRVGQCVLDAYVRLHKRGLVHGDVHPKNVLVDGHANVRIVDFEYARVIDSRTKHLDDVPRAGVIHYLEPEYAEALLAHRAVPLASPAGEQYSVAALLYHILTGDRYADFPLGRTEGLRQIVEQPPRPFSQRRRPPWPAVEEILGRALSKDPEKRFPSMGSFAEALRAIDDIPSRAPRLRGAPTEPDLHEFRKNLMERLDLSGPLVSNGFQGRLLCSVTNGSAGIAYALYRMACVTEDPRLLAAADGWIGRAERHLTDSGAFYDEAINITPETVGWTSPYHTESGVHCVRALISLAVGDGATADGAVGRFLEASAHPTDNVDVMLGQAGTLLACTNLLSAVRNRSAVSTTRLAEFGDELLHSICKPLELDPPIDHAGSANLGIAHGWAGLLYTVSRWCMVRPIRPAGFRRAAPRRACRLRRTVRQGCSLALAGKRRPERQTHIRVRLVQWKCWVRVSLDIGRSTVPSGSVRRIGRASGVEHMGEHDGTASPLLRGSRAGIRTSESLSAQWRSNVVEPGPCSSESRGRAPGPDRR